MFKFLTRGFCAVVASTALVPTTSSACCFCHCFDWCSKPAPAAACPTTYAAPACDVCPQQVSYVPQTAYRTEYNCVPCTSYRPVSTCDPCGGAQTVMQPVTTYVRRPVMVPYTTYRPVVSQVRYAAPACSTCGTAAPAPYYSGTATSVAVPAVAPTPGCSTCGGGASVGYGAAPALYSYPSSATQGYIAQPAMAAPIGTPGMPAQGMIAPSMGSPTPAMPSGSAPAPTYQGTPGPGQSSSMSYPATPIPENDAKMNSNSAPALNPQTRTTSTRPLMGPAWVTTAIFRTADRATVFQPAAQTTVVNQNDGWSGSPTSSDGWQPTGSR
jgi:hypothetical protein